MPAVFSSHYSLRICLLFRKVLFLAIGKRPFPFMTSKLELLFLLCLWNFLTFSLKWFVIFSYLFSTCTRLYLFFFRLFINCFIFRFKTFRFCLPVNCQQNVVTTGFFPCFEERIFIATDGDTLCQPFECEIYFSSWLANEHFNCLFAIVWHCDAQKPFFDRTTFGCGETSKL